MSNFTVTHEGSLIPILIYLSNFEPFGVTIHSFWFLTKSVKSPLLSRPFSPFCVYVQIVEDLSCDLQQIKRMLELELNLIGNI